MKNWIYEKNGDKRTIGSKHAKDGTLDYFFLATKSGEITAPLLKGYLKVLVKEKAIPISTY